MNINEIRELASIMNEYKLSLIEIDTENDKIKLKSSFSGTAENISLNNAVQFADNIAAITPCKKDFNNFKTITSPLVGVFYRQVSPDSPPFAEVGSIIKKGDTLCIIEAMKMMNEIVADKDGEIADICIENGQVVEFGQILFKLF